MRPRAPPAPRRLTPAHTLRPARPSVLFCSFHSVCVPVLLLQRREARDQSRRPGSWGCTSWRRQALGLGLGRRWKLGTHRALLGFYSSPAGVSGKPQGRLPEELVTKDEEVTGPVSGHLRPGGTMGDKQSIPTERQALRSTCPSVTQVLRASSTPITGDKTVSKIGQVPGLGADNRPIVEKERI